MLYVHNKSFLILIILYLANFELIIKSTYEHTIMRHTISIYVLIVHIYLYLYFFPFYSTAQACYGETFSKVLEIYFSSSR